MNASPLRTLALGAALLQTLSSPATQLYVATTGSDTDSGTRRKPFATPERARDEVRRLTQKAGLPKGGVTIWLRGGDYLRTNALELTAADSGTPNSPIVWRACKGETVRLLGGRQLSGFDPIADPAALARLPEVARGHVMQVDLKALGISDFGQMQSRGFGRPLTPAHCELFFGGRPMTLARWPNEGTGNESPDTLIAGPLRTNTAARPASWKKGSFTAVTARAGGRT